MVSAQIRVGEQAVKPKAIHVFKGGEWQQKRVGYVFRNGQWMPFINYLLNIYNHGIEGIPIVKGNHRYHGYTFEKNANHIYMNTGSDGGLSQQNLTAVTDEIIDVTNYKKAYAVVESGPSAPSAGYLIASTNKTGGIGSYDALVSEVIPYGATKVTLELDVTQLSGDFYIRVHVAGRSAQPMILLVHKIWLE